MDLLIPDSGLLFWMTLVFLIVFLILWKAGFPAIIKMVNDRKDYIDESLRKAHEANEKLANIQKEGESILQEAREKQAAILKEAAETRDAIVEKAQDKAREEGARLLSDAKTQIENEKQNAIREIRGQVAELSVQIAEKVLKAKLSDDKAQMDMINRLLDEVSSDNKQVKTLLDIKGANIGALCPCPHQGGTRHEARRSGLSGDADALQELHRRA